MRRESTNAKDLFIAHIGAMDSFARGLRNAAKIIEDGIMSKHLKVLMHLLEALKSSLILIVGTWIMDGERKFMKRWKYYL